METINQISAAQKANITQGYLSKVLSGKANPTIDVLERISEATGIELSDLIKISRGEMASPLSRIREAS